MTGTFTLLLLEDEPLIMLDLEYAAQDRGCAVLSAATSELAMAHIASRTKIDAAILDVSLDAGDTCFSVAHRLADLGIPYILHSGDLDRHNEKIREIDAELIAKPAAADRVIAAAIAHARGKGSEGERIAAE